MLCARFLRLQRAPDGCALPGARARLRAPRSALPPRAGLGPAPPAGGGRRWRSRRSPAASCIAGARADRLHDAGGPQRVQRLAQDAARQHRRADAAPRCAAARGRAAPRTRRCAPCSRPSAAACKKRVNEALLYVQLVHKSERRAEPDARSWRELRARVAALGPAASTTSRSRRCR